MIHGPCGSLNPNSPCMENGVCTKSFPKQFQTQTQMTINGFPDYKRRQTEKVIVRGREVDNQFVVPYNKILALKYNAHVNVEVCTSVKAVKYIFKYIYKGYDCANVVIDSNGNQQLNHDEVANFLDARYVT